MTPEVPVPDAHTLVGLEVGAVWTFAIAIDWPGWCRRGRGEESALVALSDYATRYAQVAGSGFRPGPLAVTGRVRGTKTTDFGAPDVIADWDRAHLEPGERARNLALLEASWRAFDAGVQVAPPQLRRGPRGGGRDRDAVTAHVQETERRYGRKVGVALPPRTPWDDQRAALVTGLGTATDTPWPVRYALQRLVWHVLDHLWEIEDKSE